MMYVLHMCDISDLLMPFDLFYAPIDVSVSMVTECEEWCLVVDVRYEFRK